MRGHAAGRPHDEGGQAHAALPARRLAAAHDAHAKAQADAKAKKRQREDLDDAAATAQARAVWEASGAQTSKLWMLPDAALVEMIGGDTDGLDRTELIARAAASRDAGGRRLLTEGDENSFRESEKLFEKALMLSRMVGDLVQVRRAVRGLAASKRGRNDNKGAIAGLKEVLSISDQLGDHVGDADALGSIADMYTEMGDLENAGKFYDLYLDALNNEMM